jgi:hypothetical protein
MLAAIVPSRAVNFSRRDCPLALSSLVLEASKSSRAASFVSRAGKSHLVMWPWLLEMSGCILFKQLLIGERCVSIEDSRAATTAATIAALISGVILLGGSAVVAVPSTLMVALPVFCSRTTRCVRDPCCCGRRVVNAGRVGEQYGRRLLDLILGINAKGVVIVRILVITKGIKVACQGGGHHRGHIGWWGMGARGCPRNSGPVGGGNDGRRGIRTSGLCVGARTWWAWRTIHRVQ